MVVLVIRTIGLMDYEVVSTATILVILAYILLFSGGFALGKTYFITSGAGKFQFKKLIDSPKKSLNFLIGIALFFTYVCVFATVLKMKDMSGRYGVELSLKGISDIRSANTGDVSYELGSNIYGMLSSIFFGFPVLCGIIALCYRNHISLFQKRILWVSFIMGMLASVLTGGRFMAFTFALFYYFGNKLTVTAVRKRQPLGRRAMVALASVLLFWLFAQMFLDRMGVRSISFAIYMLPLCQPKDYVTYLLSALPSLDTMIALFSYFEYYIGHGVNQLDVLLNAPYPLHAPYWGGYELSTFFLFFNKIGFNVITVDEIVREIVNPGVYFTHIGALYLDFGFWVSAPVVLLFGYLSGNSWIRLSLVKPKLSLIYLNVIILSLVTFAPIVSLVSAGYFPAILVSYAALVVFENFMTLPSLKSVRWKQGVSIFAAGVSEPTLLPSAS